MIENFIGNKTEKQDLQSLKSQEKTIFIAFRGLRPPSFK